MSGVGYRIKSRRNDLGLTQCQLSEKAGISKGFMSEIESGKRNMGADKLLDIARVLNLSLDYLMTGNGDTLVNLTYNIQIPVSLAGFASEIRISFRNVLALLGMQNEINNHRGNSNKINLEKVDWFKFYNSVKSFL